MSLTEHDRGLLEKAVASARHLLEGDLSAALEGSYGIHASGRLEEEAALALPTAETAAREELVGVLDHLQAEGLPAEAAVARLLREAVFTTLNRLVAVRVAEAIRILPESLAQGRASRGYREVLELFPLLTKDPTAGYWTYLRLCADELAHDAPVLFDPRNPLLVLDPSPRTLDELLAVFADPVLTPVWADPEAFGWTYQYFNTREERRAAREEAAPRDSRELAVRNQFFTPRYVVDFLVQNTLGRRILESDPDSKLREDLPLLVDPPEDRGAPLDLEGVRVLDPAVGSGHFLLGCYDLLERAWKDRGVAPGEAATRILPCLWGIDIDPRCAQVAAAALVLRARRQTKNGNLPRPKVFTARPLPEDPAAWERALAHLDGDLRGLVQSMREVLKDAPILGSLLKVEEALRQEIEQYSVEAAAGEGTLFEEFGADAFGRAEAQILAALKAIADDAASTAPERLLAAETTDALGFVEAMRSRYDTVLMNPPFGAAVAETKQYIRREYAEGRLDLYAAFVQRGLQMLSQGGYLGAITNRTGFFIATFQNWREKVIDRRPIVVADLGYGVLEDAVVEVASYILGTSKSTNTTFIRLVREVDKEAGLRAACHGHVGLLSLDLEELALVPGFPFSYWVSTTFRRMFASLPPLHSDERFVEPGLQGTKDDFRFVRAWWEVLPPRRGRGERWAPYAKGGEYSPYLGDVHLLVDWEDEGRRIEQYVVEKYPYLNGNAEWVLHRSDHHFSPGITWAERTASASSFWALPEGCVFSATGPAVVPIAEATRWELLGVLNTRLFEHLLGMLVASASEISSGTPARHYAVGLVRSLPFKKEIMTKTEWVEVLRPLLEVRTFLLRRDETSLLYSGPDASPPDYVRAFEASYRIEQSVAEGYGLDERAQRELDEEQGPHPCSYPEYELDGLAVSSLWDQPTDSLIDQVVAERGGLRFITVKSFWVDRKIEVMAHILRAHPRSILGALTRLGVEYWDDPAAKARRRLSYLVGCAFGRWDARVGRDPSLAPPRPDPFEPLPISAPGTLAGPEGSRPEADDYPLELPPDGLLLDEEGHPWDIVLRVRRAAEALFDDPDEILEEIERILGRDVRNYLRRDFFKAHLARYSRSRRKAPIYWHLAVPSRDWGLWVYVPTLSRETLFAVLREGRRKLAALSEVVTRRRAAVAKAEGRKGQRLAKQLEADEKLLGEVASFSKEAERVANFGWESDLDDGIILCAAPLADLLPTWRAGGRAEANNPADPSQARRMIKAGKYPWATVSKWADVL